MDFVRQYLERANEIVGDRTPAEEQYDREVIRWIRKGKDIGKAIAKANEKFPSEALTVEATMYDDLRARYEYLAQHEEILQKLRK